jgi:hypothetical protein
MLCSKFNVGLLIYSEFSVNPINERQHGLIINSTPVEICILGSALKMEAVRSSEMLVLTYKSTQCHNPEDQHRRLNCHINATDLDTCELRLR